jgi:acetate kinase
VGEHAPEVRSGAVNGLGFLALAVDEPANAGADGDRDISDATATVRTLVVRAREDVEIAGQVRRVLR